MCDRFGISSVHEIDKNIANLVPLNTQKSMSSAWKQFESSCSERKYCLNGDTTIEELSRIMKDFGFNMKKLNGEDYKEEVVKTMWNTVAKLLQKKYYEEYRVSFDPFKDVIFSGARKPRDAKRKELQRDSDKRKRSAASSTLEEHEKIVGLWDEETPDGLQRKFYHMAACELAWRGGEAAKCLVMYFKEERNNIGELTGRIIYDPIFEKTAQGGAGRLCEKKWLTNNLKNSDRCPVR
ncbi:hypothetical protein Zmor_006625 [Zophobas morio]|nr:hypothetical protein Zmor_006625 [Zophobas morio]